MPSMQSSGLARRLRQFADDEAGATAVEYCLVAASIFLAIVTAVTQVGIDLQKPFNTAQSGLN